MKPKYVFMTLVMSVFLLAGCGEAPPNATTPPAGTESPNVNESPENSPDGTDVYATPSMVTDNAGFEHAISNEGVWIICLLNDLTLDEELVLDGEFTNGKKDDDGNDIVQRKIALYEQDDSRNITARYTLTVPKLTINSPKASIQHGTLKGDLYVNSADFQLVDTTVDGNVYFASEDIQSSFTMDEDSEITGKQTVQEAD